MRGTPARFAGLVDTTENRRLPVSRGRGRIVSRAKVFRRRRRRRRRPGRYSAENVIRVATGTTVTGPCHRRRNIAQYHRDGLFQ